jgi:hypothetical protein
VTFTRSHASLVARLRATLGAEKYTPLRSLAVRYQHGEVGVQRFVAEAAQLVCGRVDLLVEAARALPHAARRTALLHALSCGAR